MPVTLNIIADNADQLVRSFQRLNALTTGGPVTTLANTPLDALIDMVRERLRDDGFKLEIIDQRDPNPPARCAPETQPEAICCDPEPASPRREAVRVRPTARRPRVITEPSTTTDEDITLPRPKKAASKAAPMPLDDAVRTRPCRRPPARPGHAGQHPQGPQGRKTGSWASPPAWPSKHGKDKISELPVDPFPEIRRAMEKEFPNA